MRALQAKRILISACVVGLLAVPAAAEIQSVTFKTSRKLGFLWGPAISNLLLRSQAGVEQMENPYKTLQKGIIKVRAQKDKRIDLAQLVSLLEKKVGFEPVTEVTLEMQGNLVQREGKVFFDVSETGQTFLVEKAEGGLDVQPGKKLLAAVAVLADPHVADRIILRQSNPAKRSEQKETAAAEEAREGGKYVGIWPGMTKEDVIKQLGEPPKTIVFGQKTILKYKDDLTIELQDNKVTDKELGFWILDPAEAYPLGSGPQNEPGQSPPR